MSTPMISHNNNEKEEDNPSICIPRVFKNIKTHKISETFGIVLKDNKCVERVDSIDKVDRDGKLYQRIFIHLKYWPKNETSQFVKNKLLGGENVKIVYKEPWFWQCSMSRLTKPKNMANRNKGPYILNKE